MAETFAERFHRECDERDIANAVWREQARLGTIALRQSCLQAAANIDRLDAERIAKYGHFIRRA